MSKDFDKENPWGIVEHKWGDEVSILDLIDRGKIDEIKKLKLTASNINTLDQDIGEYPLIEAVKKRNNQIVTHFLSKNPNVNILDKKGHSPLFYALVSPNHRDKDIATMLLEKGANVNQECTFKIDGKERRDTILNLARASKDSDVIDFLKEKNLYTRTDEVIDKVKNNIDSTTNKFKELSDNAREHSNSFAGGIRKHTNSAAGVVKRFFNTPDSVGRTSGEYSSHSSESIDISSTTESNANSEAIDNKELNIRIHDIIESNNDSVSKTKIISLFEEYPNFIVKGGPLLTALAKNYPNTTSHLIKKITEIKNVDNKKTIFEAVFDKIKDLPDIPQALNLLIDNGADISKNSLDVIKKLNISDDLKEKAEKSYKEQLENRVRKFRSGLLLNDIETSLSNFDESERDYALNTKLEASSLPLNLTIVDNDFKKTKFLLDNGAKIDYITHLNSDNIHNEIKGLITQYAIENSNDKTNLLNKTPAIKKFIEKRSDDFKHDFEQLRLKSIDSTYNSLKKLISKNDENSKTIFKQTISSLYSDNNKVALKLGAKDFIQEILEKKDEKGNTLLHDSVSALSPNKDIINEILKAAFEAQIDICSIKNQNGDTAYDLSILNRYQPLKPAELPPENFFDKFVNSFNFTDKAKREAENAKIISNAAYKDLQEEKRMKTINHDTTTHSIIHLLKDKKSIQLSDSIHNDKTPTPHNINKDYHKLKDHMSNENSTSTSFKEWFTNISFIKKYSRKEMIASVGKNLYETPKEQTISEILKTDDIKLQSSVLDSMRSYLPFKKKNPEEKGKGI